ncbi:MULTISPECIES: carbohydrate porin [unclassified Oceanispirochaeta]|uniref:carbohydrate porin n=1 Tax=unclassified Oceanispirochaeta TaxID=2635722 RepID=UPI000E0933FA|nr:MULTISPECIES: carbohydrate porin [unclassified Oceanispirochaeta]MBF9018032.1 carbohydrate porin [Oceanispirochaeta sp. M2]NPD73887.1 hypothetical protein [Oceanispirochaeta sp. M1]RDG30347.1 hypothetical protein DV872_17465 [Oceanispirochaeta sp. M1]
MKKVLFLFAVLLCAAVLSAEAPDAGFSYSGYARGGIAGNARGEALGTANPFTANGAYSQARFANESNYSEHLFRFTGLGDAMWWQINTRIALDIPGFPKGWNNISDLEYGIILPEAYIRMGWNEKPVSVWVGNRYHDSIGINMYDYYINDMSGAYGGGVDGIALGSSTLDTGYFMAYGGSDNAAAVSPAIEREGTIHSLMVRPHFSLGDNRLSFKVVPSFATGSDDARYGGIFEADFEMSSFFGLAEGSTQFFGYYDLGTGVNNSEYCYYETDAYRTGGGFQGGAEFSDKISMRTTVMIESRGNQDSASDGIWTAFAIRPYYGFTNMFGITFEYDLDYFIYDDTSNDESMLNRFTLAPTLTIDSNGTVFSDPVIHAFVTYAIGDMDASVLLEDQDDQGFKYGLSFSVGW